MRFNLIIDEKNSYRTLGQLVRYNRLRNQYSLRDLSALSNISHTLISNIEKGKVSSHPDTLKELLKVLGIEFKNDKEIVEEFVELYNELFNFLFEYEYTKSKPIMDKLLSNEEKYINSIVAAEYLLIKYLYLALTDELYGEYQESIEQFVKLYEYLGDNQKQIFSLIYGVYKYNQGIYSEAYENFRKAKKVGSTELDMLVDVYIVKTFVKMYRFMDVISLSDKLIVDLESELLYLRAMEVRLSIAYSHIIVLKFDSAFELLNKIYRFAKFYNAVYILGECDLLYATIYFKQRRYELAEIRISKVIDDTLIVSYVKMKLAYILGKKEEVMKYYREFQQINRKKKFVKSEYLLKIVLNDLGLEIIDDKEIQKMFAVLLEFGKKSIDLELIDAAYSLNIKYYKERKMYKKALELSEEARGLRKYGVNFKKIYK